MPWAKETAVERDITENFHFFFQFYHSFSACTGDRGSDANQRIMRIGRGLWHKHLRATFDEVHGANISHDLGTGVDLGVKLLLELL